MDVKKRSRKLLITHHSSLITVKKPWGKEIWWAVAPKYVGKFLVIHKDHRLSLQYHRVKHETLYTWKGKYVMELNGRKKIQKPGSVVVIPPGTKHRMHAKFGNVTIIEVSTPEVKDVVRLEDDYGRIKIGVRG
ncbi:MAG: cupin domain-containing protein [Elusimicrobia bacterium]|nr:cupin domain-containing protein [Elusimicrobiota bacterium]